MKNLSNLKNKNLTGAVILFFAIILAIMFIKTISFFLLMVILALIFGTIFNAPVNFLQKFKIPRIISLTLCLFVIFGIIYDIGIIMIPKATPEFSKLIKSMPQISSKLDRSIKEYCENKNIDDIFGISYEQMKNNIKGNYKKNISFIANKAKEIGKSNLESLSMFVICLIMTIFIVLDPKTLEKGFLDPWDWQTKKRIRKCMLRIQKMLFCWAIGLLFGCICIFLLTWLGLSIIRFPFSCFFALVAGFLNIIPTIGPIISAILPCFLALILNPKILIFVLAIYIIVQQIESNILTPMIMKKQLDVHPFILISAICVMGYYFGALGCFIAAPTMAAARIIYEEFYSKPKHNAKKSLQKNKEEK